MKCEILFCDKSTLTIKNIKKVTNASTCIPNDWLYVYGQGDIEGYPSFKYCMSNIICVEVVNDVTL